MTPDSRAPSIPRPSAEAIEAALDDVHDLDQDAHEILTAALFHLSADAQNAVADAAVRQVNLKGMTVEQGATLLELDSPRELVIPWVWAARELLGDAPNYSETRIDFPTASASMEVKAAYEVERFVLTVQRAGKVTPHEARTAAEAERDALAALLPAVDAVLQQMDQYGCMYEHDGPYAALQEARRSYAGEKP